MFRKIPIRTLLFGVVALGSVILVGCGGGNGASKAGTGGTTTGVGTATGPSGSAASDTPMTPTAITTVMNAADIQFSSIVNSTPDHDARNQQMVAWLKTRPEFVAEGVTPGVDSVWGRLKNGHLYVATSSFIPGETRAAAPGRGVASTPVAPLPVMQRSALPSSQSGKSAALPVVTTRAVGATRAASSDTQLPANPQARVLISLDAGFYNPPDDQIANMLLDHKYNVIHQVATVENLKSVQGDGAFWWGTHGSAALDRNNKGFWTVGTATDVTDANNATYKADLDDGSLTYFTAAYQLGPDGHSTILKTRYAITYNFIVKYKWSFAPQCFIFMDCCYSDSNFVVIDMGNRGGSTGMTYGWSNSVGVDAAWKAGAFAFDRLLGANQVTPLESVAQRPFDAKEVYFEMAELHLDDGSVNGNTCKLVARPATAGAPALTPSIMNMEMSERIQESPLKGQSKLTLHGIFGVDKGTVKVGGVEVPVNSWKADTIECQPADLPGPGFAGDVQVISHDRPSNSVPLTQWHGKLTYSIDLLPPQASNAVSTVTCDVYFRGDIHEYRDAAGKPVNPPKPFNFRAAQGSTGHWQVTGDPVPMAAWSQPLSADLPFGLNGTVNTPYGTGYIVSGVVDSNAGTVKFSFSFLGCATAYNFPGTAAPEQQWVTIRDPLLTSQGTGVGSDGYVLYANNIPGTIGDTDFVIPGQTLTGSTPVLNPKLVLTDFLPTSQPDDNKGEDDGH